MRRQICVSNAAHSYVGGPEVGSVRSSWGSAILVNFLDIACMANLSVPVPSPLTSSVSTCLLSLFLCRPHSVQRSRPNANACMRTGTGACAYTSRVWSSMSLQAPTPSSSRKDVDNSLSMHTYIHTYIYIYIYIQGVALRIDPNIDLLGLFFIAINYV